MPLRLDSQSADFADRFRSLLALKRETAQDVEQTVRDIIADVVARGDRALFELTAKFDRVDLAKTRLRVATAEIEAAEKSCDANAIAALKVARDRIEAYHQRQKPSDDRFTDSLGVEMGAKWTAIEAVGLYVPGGTAAYPSSVLMNAVPAKVAGVSRLAMVVPAPDGKLNPLVLAAARLPGSTRFIASVVRRRSPRWPMGPTALRLSPRSSGREMPTLRRPNGWCSARSASIWSPGRPRF